MEVKLFGRYNDDRILGRQEGHKLELPHILTWRFVMSPSSARVSGARHDVVRGAAITPT
jgi:hypothetical protein